MIITIISTLMLTAGIQIVIYLYKEQKKDRNNQKFDGAIMDSNNHSEGREFNPRALAKNAADSIEFSSRMRQLSVNAEDSIKLSIAAMETGHSFGRNGDNDPFASMMIVDALSNNVPNVEGAFVLSREQRQALARDFANTHLGKIASFTHSIDIDGKMIISADAIGFLTSEYDPILLPGGLVSIVVKNEVEESIYKAILTGTPIYIQNETNREVSRIDISQIKTIVKNGNFDEVIGRNLQLEQEIKTLQKDVKTHQENNAQITIENSKLKDQNDILVKALQECQSQKNNSQKKEQIDVKPEEKRVKTEPAIARTLPQAVEKIPTQNEPTVVAVEAQAENQKTVVKFSSIVGNIIKKQDNLRLCINNQKEWGTLSIFYIFVERGMATIYFEKNLLKSMFSGDRFVDDIEWGRTLFYDDFLAEGYFAFTHSVQIEIDPGLKGYSAVIFPYDINLAKQFIQALQDSSITDGDERYGVLSNFIAGKRVFKHASEMFQ